jgi:hypothetical protein
MMSRKDVEWIKAETRRLEALGVVLGMLGLSAFETKPAGRPRQYQSAAEKKRAYRERKAKKPLSIVKKGRKKWPLGKVRDVDLARKAEASTI